MPSYPTVPPDHWDKASKMRKQATPAERVLWRALRLKTTQVSFRRQHPIGPYIVDFVCINAKLIIELDGGGHVAFDQIKYDKARDEYLRVRGFRILRYFNNDVLRNLEGVMNDITEALKG